ncbi:MAG TPA: TolC family protein [Rhizobacter sp.]
MNQFFYRPAVLAATASLLAGCASFSTDGGFDRVSELTRERTGQGVSAQRSPQAVDSAAARVAEILKTPLSADTAVELALLNNRGLQASFSELGLAEADLVQAGRLRNPSFSFGRLAAGGVVEIERAVLFDVLGLLTMPVARRVQEQGFEQAQFRAAHEAVGVASDARRAYFEAVAARELVTYFAQVKEAADASNELARRMLAAGNFNKLAQMREQSFHADATAGLARAQQQALSARERLVRLLGLDGTQQRELKLPERLPELPPAPTELKDAEQTALDKRLDLQMARRTTEATARSLGLTRATRFVNVLELGYQNKSETGEPRANGFELELELPIFDFGAVRNARAQAIYMQALHRTAEVAVNARSEARESYAAYRSAYELARHYRDEVVPLRKRISEENLLRYNGMLIGVFDLLADAREQVRSVTDYVQALRDHWIAETQLQTALTGRSPGAAASSSSPAPAAEQRAGH